jgi:hypothetical protein
MFNAKSLAWIKLNGMWGQQMKLLLNKQEPCRHTVWLLDLELRMMAEEMMK